MSFNSFGSSISAHNWAYLISSDVLFLLVFIFSRSFMFMMLHDFVLECEPSDFSRGEKRKNLMLREPIGGRDAFGFFETI